MDFVKANGLKFAYLSEGSGPLVLLFHGFPDTAHTWDFALPRIAAKGYRAVAPFMRGYSPTEIPKADTDQGALARDVLALVEALGEKEAVLVGHDWGATAVYGATSLDSSRVKKLVTVAIPHPATIAPTPRKAWALRHFMAYKFPGAAGRFRANDLAALPAIYKRWSPAWSPADSEFDHVRTAFADAACCDAAFGYYRKLEFTVPRELGRKITVPTVVFSGDDDPIMSHTDYERARSMFEGSYTIERMPGGHFMHREHPEIFVEKLLAHL